VSVDRIDSIIKGGKMTTYFLFGKYSQEAIKEISSERSTKANDIIESNGGKFVSGYALLGDIDLVLIVDFPGTEQAMKAAVDLAKILGIGFTTAPAVNVEEFDRLIV
jgi:uncharacterized protein with GYD domain